MAAPGRSPIEPRSDGARTAVRNAAIWIGLAGLAWIGWQLAEALLLVFAGLVFAAGLQSGEALLAKLWKAPYGVRLAVVVILFLGLVIGFLAFAGVTLVAQAQQLGATLDAQIIRFDATAHEYGVSLGQHGQGLAGLKAQLGGQVGRLTAFIGSALGGLGALLLILTLGIYIAAEPRLYERGVEWLTPMAARDAMRSMLTDMGHTLRRWLAGRLLTMAIEGVLIFVGLAIIGVPLAGLLGLVSALLAFIPTLGAMMSGVLIVAVGLSAGTSQGLWAFGVYLLVQGIEGNVLTPLIEKRAVDLAPAVVLVAQLMFGILFGLLGVALADPIVAVVKVALDHRGKRRDDATAA